MTQAVEETSSQGVAARNRVRQRRKTHSRPGLTPARSVVPYLFVGGALLIVVVGLAYPAIHGIIGSFFATRFSTDTGPFVGFENYRNIASDPLFWNSLRRTLVFIGGCILLTLTLAVLFAMALHRLGAKAGTLTTAVLAPYLVSTVAAAEIFRLFFNSQLGFPAFLWSAVGAEPITWLGHPRNSMLVIILAFAWLTTPLAMLIVLAGLQAIDPDLVGAAAVDGANTRQRFLMITLPLIARQVSLALLWISFHAANTFGIILPLTGGGPAGATETLPVFMYFTSFARFQHSEAMAVMVVLLLLNGSLSMLYLRTAREA